MDSMDRHKLSVDALSIAVRGQYGTVRPVKWTENNLSKIFYVKEYP